MPWHYFRILLKRNVDVHLFVHARTSKELIATFPQHLDRIHFVPDTWLHKFLYRISCQLPAQIAETTTSLASQLLTQAMQRRALKRIHAAVSFDIVHQPTPVSPKAPALAMDLDVPVVVGPMNGGMEYPPGMRDTQFGAVRLLVATLRWLSTLVHWLVPGKRRAAAILVANQRTFRALPNRLNGTIHEVVENGVDLSVWHGAASSTAADAPFVFLGRLVGWKAVDILLEAVALATQSEPVRLVVIGDGPERVRLERRTLDLQLGRAVEFVGFLPQTKCAELVRGSRALVLPSLFECGGAVVLEAMSLGVPVIATRWGGPADYLDDSCGVLVEPRSRKQVCGDLAEAMLRLHRSPELAQRLGREGRRKVAELYDWERKVDRVLDIYRETSARYFGAHFTPAERGSK